jgi:hypothetical protein
VRAAERVKARVARGDRGLGNDGARAVVDQARLDNPAKLAPTVRHDKNRVLHRPLKVQRSRRKPKPTRHGLQRLRIKNRNLANRKKVKAAAQKVEDRGVDKLLDRESNLHRPRPAIFRLRGWTNSNGSRLDRPT